MVNERVYDLIERARDVRMTDAEREVQRMNFVYGNVHMENEQVTREMARRHSRRGDGTEEPQRMA